MTAPAEPPKAQRSESEILSSLQDTVSASRLTVFLQCRLKFYFRHVLGLKKTKAPALHVGSSVHAVLKAWNKARWLQKPLTLKDIHERFSEAWADDSEGPVAWEGEEVLEKATAWRLCETYLRECPMDPDIKPDAVDVPVEAELKEHGLPTLHGILDLVQQGRIIDYKTASSTPQPEKVAHTHEVQTSLYAVLYRANRDRKETGMELHHLVKLKNPKVVITTLPPMSDEQQSRLFRLLESYSRGVQRRDFVPSPGMQCSSCEFFNECRRW